MYPSYALTDVVSLKVIDYKHLTFKDIASNEYKNDQDTLTINVDRSSSFLVMPFASAMAVRKVKFEWRGTTVSAVRDAAHEASKDGDDASLRLGLLLAGDPPLVPFFAPSWVKAVKGILKLPSSKLMYLIPGARHGVGTVWKSPYSDSVECLSLSEGRAISGGPWREVEFTASETMDVVGVWIMADGDNTGSKFTSEIRNLSFHSMDSVSPKR